MATVGLDFGRRAKRPVGVDEVGRGPLAGPVVAAAVILGNRDIAGITDSKALTARKRAVVAEEIRAHAMVWAVGRAEPDEIDALDIRRASLLAMERALDGLSLEPDYAWVDGRECPRLPCPGEAVVGGDGAVAAVGAASILAKQVRDTEMIDWGARMEGYGFERHKGYPTSEHLAALDRLGPCHLHRRSFGPVRRRLSEE